MLLVGSNTKPTILTFVRIWWVLDTMECSLIMPPFFIFDDAWVPLLFTLYHNPSRPTLYVILYNLFRFGTRFGKNHYDCIGFMANPSRSIISYYQVTKLLNANVLMYCPMLDLVKIFTLGSDTNLLFANEACNCGLNYYIVTILTVLLVFIFSRFISNVD